MLPLISVIIPVYKVELYLRRCLESVINQTYMNLEIILVDDGSPDDCGKICDEYAGIDNRICVIHKENGGLSSARNAGLEIAKGEYIGFVDSDDWIEQDMYEFLYNSILKTGADMSVCGCIEHKQYENNRQSSGGFTNCYRKDCFVRSTYDTVKTVLLPGSGMVVWNKLFRAELFIDIRFPEGKLFEDIFVMVRLASQVNKSIWHAEAKYHYCRREDSITLDKYRPALLDCIEAQLENYNYICKWYPSLEREAEFRCFWSYFYVLDSMVLDSETVEKDEMKRIIQFLKSSKKNILSNPIVSKARKVLLISLCIHKSLYKMMVIIWKYRNEKLKA